MTELEIMQRAKMYMDKLSRGIDPVTDRQLLEDTSLNNPRLSKCFSYVSGVLQQVIENGGYVGAKPKAHPFVITPEQMCRVQLSRDPLRTAQLAERLVQATGDPLMKRPTNTIANWMHAQGFLEKETLPEGKSRRVPTQKGTMLGLSMQMYQSQYGDYMAVVYNAQAQRFVLDNLPAILAEQKPQG